MYPTQQKKGKVSWGNMTAYGESYAEIEKSAMGVTTADILGLFTGISVFDGSFDKTFEERMRSIRS